LWSLNAISVEVISVFVILLDQSAEAIRRVDESVGFARCILPRLNIIECEKDGILNGRPVGIAHQATIIHAP
jgi:hypothetical protein